MKPDFYVNLFITKHSYFIIFNQFNYNKTQDIIPIISVFAFAAFDALSA